MEFELRPALDSEAKQLSDLASRSKAYWPYEESYLAVVRSTNHITSEDILKWPVVEFLIASDPYAEPFYLKMGAVRIGERESKIKKGFFMPLLEYRIT